MSTGIRPEQPYIVCGKGGCKGWTPTKERVKVKLSVFEQRLKREKFRREVLKAQGINLEEPT